MFEDYNKMKENIFSMPDALKRIMELSSEIPEIEKRMEKQEQMIGEVNNKLEQVTTILQQLQQSDEQKISEIKDEVVNRVGSLAQTQQENRKYMEEKLAAMDNASRMIYLATVMSAVDDVNAAAEQNNEIE